MEPEKLIIGRKIDGIYQTKCKIFDGVEASTLVVGFEDGVCIEIDYYETIDQITLYNICDRIDIVSASLPEKDKIIGSKIIDIIFSDSWPSIGLEIDTGLILTCRDFGTPFVYGPFVYTKEELLEDDFISLIKEK